MNLTTGPSEITTRFQTAWNTHDMEVFGRLFHPDATFVNRFATYWRGVNQIVAGHTGIHASIYRDSTLTIDVPDVDPISDDAAILHFWSRLNTGDAHPAGPHQIDTLILRSEEQTSELQSQMRNQYTGFIMTTIKKLNNIL